MWSKAFWRATAERATKTLTQTVVAGSVTAAALSEVDWIHVLDVAGLATLLSVGMSIVVALSTDGNPSLGDAETLTPNIPIVSGGDEIPEGALLDYTPDVPEITVALSGTLPDGLGDVPERGI